jgi:D-glycero-D-manno-heptose 1,7-bisphosphate phosphatase
MNQKSKAIFLDRDGVINIEKNYLYKVDDFEFIDGVFDALQYFQDLGYKLFIITNQSGINREYYTKKDFQYLTKWMLGEFKYRGINILDVQFCPHTQDENCNCRKPKTGMIDNILDKFDIDLENSWLIGDKNSDIMCAKNAGIKNTIQVESGHNFDTSMADFVIPSLKNISLSTLITL